ncbi:GAF domain-containing protein [uncultured Caulobacter sp.]|mgnify:CR=1 FL=1|uniref:GAF domain-containing protein n=1 Tax=uncultured Caulobacter sp. TaxID=158749 RepID=UPI00263A31FA|nr:GAF domain-containing protein [uncultured Caulobacter sp.]
MLEIAKRRHSERIRGVLADGSAAARSALAASWIRSSSCHGLSPEDASAPCTLTSSELREAQQRIEPLISAAQSSLDRLFRTIGANGCCVLLTDQQGVPVDRRGAEADDETFRRWGLWTGAIWSEAVEGTNGIGTCLAEERALTIHRDQHFRARNIAMSCSVAPIYDHQGRLAAAIDVSSCRVDCTEGFVDLILASVADAARRIEAEHFQRMFPQSRLIFVDCHKHGGGLLAVDRDDLVIGATRSARLAHHLDDQRILARLHVDELLFPESRLDESLIHLERSGVQHALARTSGNVSAAAKALGVSRATLYRKLDRLGLAHRA